VDLTLLSTTYIGLPYLQGCNNMIQECLQVSIGRSDIYRTKIYKY